MIVAVDGPAGVGKSTVCSRVAEELGIFGLNSGNFYRAVTLAVLQAGSDPEDREAVIAAAKASSFTLENGRIHLNGTDVEDDLHNDRIDAWVAQHSAIVPVRHLVNRILRDVTSGLDAAVEGRDIGTVVFPDAQVKIYLDADIEVRADRRLAQGVSSKTRQQLVASIAARDKIDRNKEEGSLRVAPDALYLDTSDLTIQQVCATVLRQIRDSRASKQPGR